MNMHLQQIFSSQAHTQILKVLANTTKPYAVREIIALAEVGTRSACSILKSFLEDKLVEKNFRGQEVVYNLTENDDRKELLIEIFLLAERRNIKLRSTQYQQRAKKIMPAVIQLKTLTKKAKDSLGHH